MSYHVQQNTQQRSLGIFIVVAFHVLLIWGLANGLGRTIVNLIPEAIKLTPVQQQVTPPPPIDIPMPQIGQQTKITIDPITPPIGIDDGNPLQVISPGDGGVIDRSTVSITKPRLIHATKPDYPIAASRLGEEGVTGLSIHVTANGRVAEAKVFSPSGSTRLDDAALKHALRNWAFTPCMEGDKAVDCWHQTKLVWRLEDAKR